MRKIPLLFWGLGLSMSLNAQVGINTETPGAALDVKSKDNDGNKVLRFSTKPNEIGVAEKFVFFVGKEVAGGYDLRRITLQEIVKSLSVEIPSLRRIAITNTRGQLFSIQGNYPVKADKLIFNSSEEDFAQTPDGGVKIKKAGAYEVSSWVGFKVLSIYEGDIIISLAKKSKGQTKYTNFKRAVLSRSNNRGVYDQGNGVGASFSFIENFQKDDELILQVNIVTSPAVDTMPGSVNLSVTRVDKDSTVVAVGQ
ncbi:MAG: hypothetical protein Q4A00_03620 [Flavobacteriaceae bacterium]|nr:hypothetical protein [Flavobacteriaceae bacterium]